MVDVIMEQEDTETVQEVTARAIPTKQAAGFVAPERFTEELVTLFKLLSDETRLRILLALMETKEMHVRALCELLGQSQPAVSHHLALLRVEGLIQRRREGKHNYYHLEPGEFEKLLDLVFAGQKEDGRQIRFKDYVLQYDPR